MNERSAPSDPRWRAFIERQIASARGGSDSIEPMGSLSGSPDDGALALISLALNADRDPDVRERHVRLLASIGLATDPAVPQGGAALRDPRIIARLVAGLSEPNTMVTESYLNPLMLNVPPELLAVHHTALLARLGREPPDESLLLVVARAKPAGALPRVEAIAARRGWASNWGTRVALAALGRADIERSFIDEFLASQDGDDKARRARALGFIATPAALGALCREMRSPLTTGSVYSVLCSVRIDLIGALRRAYPAERTLFENVITSDVGYAAVESFCHAHFGTLWTIPRPPFLWAQGAPIPLPPPPSPRP